MRDTLRVDDICGTAHKHRSPPKRLGSLQPTKNITWDYSDVNKTTAQKRRQVITRITDPLEPIYEFKRDDGSKFFSKLENKRSSMPDTHKKNLVESYYETSAIR